MKTLIFIILGSLSACIPFVDKENPKPNIIFLLSDDQRDNTFGSMGNPYVKSPNIDQLVQEGVRFSNAYIAEPTCCPSRVAILTGSHERVNGIGFTSSYKLTEDQWKKSYPSLLRENGYYTGFIGKFGVQHYTFRGNGSEKFDYWRAHDGWARFWPKTAENCEEYFDSEEDIITPVMGESIERFLQTAPNNKPFCLSVSFSVPHGSQTASMYPESDEAVAMLIPANENPKLKQHPFYDTLYRGVNIKIPEETGKDPYVFIPKFILDQSQGRMEMLKYSYNPVSCKEHHIRYYQQISAMDDVIGGMLKSLKEKGLSENTVIIFASDHGLLMGEYGMGGKSLLYDLTLKIPCLIYDPRVSENNRGKTVDNLVSSLDLPTTILDYAGIRPPSSMQGQSLVPLLNGKNQKWRDELFFENLYSGRDNPFCEGIRKGDWKYIRMFDGIKNYMENDVNFKGREPDFEQLFNLKDDPEEKVNLIDNYEESDLLLNLREKCAFYSDELNNQRKIYMAENECLLR